MESAVERLVRQLDRSPYESMEARTALVRMGREVIPAVVRGLPNVGACGQMTAIEVFEDLGDLRCVPGLIDLLGSETSVVREWAALALGGLGAVEAVEPLRRAYRACRKRRTPPDWSEPGGFRWALTELGAREPVIPPLTAGLRRSSQSLGAVWPTDRLEDLANDLADHDQVVLYFQFWQISSRGTYGVSESGMQWDLDWSASWQALVEQARQWATLAATDSPTREGVVATITWIDRSDYQD